MVFRKRKKKRRNKGGLWKTNTKLNVKSVTVLLLYFVKVVKNQNFVLFVAVEQKLRYWNMKNLIDLFLKLFKIKEPHVPGYLGRDLSQHRIHTTKYEDLCK